MLLLIFRDTKLQSKDGRYTQGELMRIIRSEVRKWNNSPCDNSEVANHIMNNFSINGIIDTYNQVGINGFISIVRQMVDMENYERRVI